MFFQFSAPIESNSRSFINRIGLIDLYWLTLIDSNLNWISYFVNHTGKKNQNILHFFFYYSTKYITINLWYKINKVLEIKTKNNSRILMWYVIISLTIIIIFEKRFIAKKRKYFRSFGLEPLTIFYPIYQLDNVYTLYEQQIWSQNYCFHIVFFFWTESYDVKFLLTRVRK